MQWSSDEECDWELPQPKHEVEEIMSSQEVKRSSGSRDLVPNDPYIEFLDMKACKLVRRYGDKLVEATMKPGDDGFAIAEFEKLLESNGIIIIIITSTITNTNTNTNTNRSQ